MAGWWKMANDGSIRGSEKSPTKKRLKTDGEKGEGLGPNLAVDLTESLPIDVDESKNCDVDKGAMELDSDSPIINNSSGERNRESMLRMMNWVVGVAKNPCDPLVAPLPEISKWQLYGDKELWKQVLKVREGLSSSRRQLSTLKKNQRMHPCIYDDDSRAGYNLRERTKCSKKSDQPKSSSQSSAPVTQPESGTDIDGHAEDNSSAEKLTLDLPIVNCVPIGKRVQADVPEWSGVISESDQKWIGTRVWPQEDINRWSITETEPIGKGRQDSCGCVVPKSVECVRLHICERKQKMKLEIGPAFSHWGFDKMGEEIAYTWTKAEEKKFDFLMKSECSSLPTCWTEKINPFPNKTREDLLSYYYNVYMLQRRAKQNRDDPDNIDSGDELEEAEDPSGNGNAKRQKRVG